MHVARLEMQSRFAKEIARTLSLETGGQSPRSSAGLTAEEDRLILRVEGEDTVALRAAMNSYLRWLGMAEKIAKDMSKSQVIQ